MNRQNLSPATYPSLEYLLSQLLPDGAEPMAKQALRDNLTALMFAGEPVVSRISPAVAKGFPSCHERTANRVHYLTSGTNEAGHFGYVIRPRPEFVPEHVCDEEAWIESLIIWELVGLVERFPTAPLTSSPEIEATSHDFTKH
ncbi:MAG: hypothetical protein AAGD04_01640 [Pseudomonadota bacterium]